MAGKRTRHFGRTLLILLLLAVIAGAFTVNAVYLGPYGGQDTDIFVDIEHGMSSRAIANELAEQGLVRAPWVFLLVRAFHPRSALQAGEYRFETSETPWQILNKLRKGQVFYEEITVPEGSNMFDIANILRSGDTVRPTDFLRAASDPASIRDLDPHAPNLEGFLFPSTYRVTHKTTARQLCRAMTSEFRKRWAALGGANRQRDVHKTVTLASLVEKETAVPAERPMVAAVYANRLSSGMLLQCDPTTVYAALLENRYHGTIHKSDLASANPYNTYLHAGLPPGPIANPGATSLAAALKPADSSFLYFVAKPDGSGAHHFSTTLNEHETAVAALRRAGK